MIKVFFKIQKNENEELKKGLNVPGQAVNTKLSVHYKWQT